ncbi:MAG TPA: UDP-N-acetylglucosamine 2-epimerase [Candidatus Nanoarchaeia archaeon]|nr:UDP-N-acetylglucosamine 2-epimerase [Candidatus Nanoarchaeia archaeon]
MIDELNDFLSDWSQKKIVDRLFDQDFNLEGVPLSWFYRPIIYSNLLPSLFPSVDEIRNGKKRKPGIIRLLFMKEYLWYVSWRKRNRIDKKNNISSSEDQSNSKAMFLAFTNQIYFNKEEKIPKLEQVIDKINSEGILKPIIITVDPFSKYSPKILKNCKNTLYDYNSKNVIDRADNISKGFSSRWKRIDRLNKEKMLTSNSKSYWGLSETIFNFLYSQEFIFSTIYHYKLLCEAMSKNNIKVLILTSQNNIIEKCALAAAKKKGIPVLIIQHGIGLGTFKTVDLISSEKFAVWGGCFGRSLKSLGLSDSAITITGNLAFDGFNSNEITFLDHIFIATSCYIEDRFISKKDYFKTFSKVINDLVKLSNKKIIIKTHPRERNIKEYQKIITSFNNPNILLITKTDRDEYKKLLLHSSIILTFGSTICLEAVALNKRTIVIDPFSGDSPLTLIKPHIGSIPFVSWQDDIYLAVKNLLKEKIDQQENVGDLLYRIDGNAYVRVVDEIYKLANQSSKAF